MPNNYQITIAKDQGDLEGLAELENVIFENESFGIGTLQREMDAGYVVVVYTEDVYVPYGVGGYAIVRPGPPITDLLRLGVHPRLQGRGMGSALLDHVLAKFDGPMMLAVRKNNTHALSLYKKRGFEIVATTDASWVMRLG